MSLAFHIIFAVVGIGMPVLMVIAERRWLRTGDAGYLELAKRWAKGTAILFAVGAVSGTVLSLRARPALARLHGVRRPASSACRSRSRASPSSPRRSSSASTSTAGTGSPPRAHLLAGGIVVAVSGALSRHLRRDRERVDEHARRLHACVDGQLVERRSDRRRCSTPRRSTQTLHMTLAAYAATGFAVAGIHAFLLLRDPDERLPPARAQRRAPGRRPGRAAPAARRAT